VTTLDVAITQNFDTLPASGSATFTNDSTASRLVLGRAQARARRSLPMTVAAMAETFYSLWHGHGHRSRFRFARLR